MSTSSSLKQRRQRQASSSQLRPKTQPTEAPRGPLLESNSVLMKRLEKQAKQWFLIGKKLSSRYRMLVCLESLNNRGSMDNSTMWEAEEVGTGRRVTLRITKRANIHLEHLCREVGVLEQLHHTNIVDIIDAFFTRKNVIIVTSSLPHQTLLEGLQQMSEHNFREDVIAWVIFQILQALQYCHEKGVAHRDLRPTNIAFEADNPTNPSSILIKLIDFGWARFIALANTQTLTAQNIAYAAPEVITLTIKPEHECKADLWSVGVILYELLSGSPPWTEAEVPSIATDGPNLDALFDTPLWTNTISDAAISFLRTLLVHSPQRRSSVQEALEHRWITMFNRGQEWAYEETGAVLKQAFQSIAFRGTRRGASSSAASAASLKTQRTPSFDLTLPNWQSLFLDPATNEDLGRGSTYRLILTEYPSTTVPATNTSEESSQVSTAPSPLSVSSLSVSLPCPPTLVLSTGPPAQLSASDSRPSSPASTSSPVSSSSCSSVSTSSAPDISTFHKTAESLSSSSSSSSSTSSPFTPGRSSKSGHSRSHSRSENKTSSRAKREKPRFSITRPSTVPILDLVQRETVELAISPYTARLFAEKLREENLGDDANSASLAVTLTELETYADENIGSTDETEEAEELVSVKSTNALALEPEQEAVTCDWSPHVWYAPLGKEICRNCFKSRAFHSNSD